MDLAETAVQAALARGASVPGWKLVQNRATRKWANKDAAATALAELIGSRVPARTEDDGDVVRLGTRHQRQILSRFLGGQKRVFLQVHQRPSLV